MLHFLLQNNRKKVIGEYILRTLILLLLSILISFIILVTFFLPSFFFAEYKNKTVLEQAQSVNLTSVKKYESSVSFMKNINGMAKALSYGKSRNTLITDLINKIILLKNPAITISDISLASNDSVHTENIIIKGISGSRDGLTSFYNDLKGDGSFQNVILPVSSLIEDTNAPFTITLSYATN